MSMNSTCTQIEVGPETIGGMHSLYLVAFLDANGTHLVHLKLVAHSNGICIANSRLWQRVDLNDHGGSALLKRRPDPAAWGAAPDLPIQLTRDATRRQPDERDRISS